MSTGSTESQAKAQEAVHLPEPLLQRVEQIAVALNTTSSELVSDVVKRAVQSGWAADLNKDSGQ
jgi:actin-like ATPase involved in cell morphogenesis